MDEKELKVSVMTVSDVCKTQLFADNLENVIDEWRLAHKNAGLTRPLKRHPIDYLTEKHLFKPHYMRKMYIDVINKESTFSANVRQFINKVGFEAYSRTIETLKSYEKENISNDGNN